MKMKKRYDIIHINFFEDIDKKMEKRILWFNEEINKAENDGDEILWNTLKVTERSMTIFKITKSRKKEKYVLHCV